MIHNYKQHELHEVLEFDTDVMNGTTFTPEERWAINLDRSKLLREKADHRPSILKASTLDKINQVRQAINGSRWTSKNEF